VDFSVLLRRRENDDETMRYWLTGLPPSSPPPPTSPVLQFQTDDEDMDDIGNAMSDLDGLIFEQDTMDQQQELQSLSGVSDYMNSDIPFDHGHVQHYNKDSSLLPLPGSDPVVQNGITNFDF
jgi:hypothetical protein